MSPVLETSPAINSLRRRWLGYTIGCLALCAAGTAGLRLAWGAAYALRWLLLAALVMGYLLAVLWRGLPYNHRLGESQLLPGLGAANHATLLRGLLLAALTGFLFSPRPSGLLAWLPGLLYTLAVGIDNLDGYLARRTNRLTRLGEMLDMSFDGLGVMVAALLAVQYRQLPLWYLSVALARYIYLAVLWTLRHLGKPTYDLPPNASRRGFAGLQMGFLAVLLWPIFSPPGTFTAAIWFALPFLAGFARDGLIASGVLQPQAALPGRDSRIARWLAVGLRLLAAALLLGTPASAWGLEALAVLAAVVTLSVALGLAGRLNAILGLMLLGLNQLYRPLAPTQFALLAAYTGLLFIGTGAFSLWTPEDRLIYRSGERIEAGEA
jgi:CDP-diacylglycerol--glycerol-3-phosphate 3-phosphatidyltransferase